VNTNIYSQICNTANLNLAYAQIRMKKPAFDQLAVADYESHLELNLEDLAGRLREGSYYPVSARIFESDEYSFAQTMRIIEDRIVQRAVFNAIAPLFEPAFSDCSFGSHRNREARMAVQQILVHWASGDKYIVRVDISEEVNLFDHDNLIYLLGTQINDHQLLRLIRMWINCSLATPPMGKIEEEFGGARIPRDTGEALKRLGFDAARITLESTLLALASNPRYRRIFTKKNIAFAGAAAFAAMAYPTASRLLREKLSSGRSQSTPESPNAFSCPPPGSLDSTLVGLMTDLALHRFDVAMTGAGWRLVRYLDSFAITTPGEADAQFALEQAERELRRLDIPINPRKAGIASFEDGVEFLGYRISEPRTRIIPPLQKIIARFFETAGADL
jgi:hypothetical protein